MVWFYGSTGIEHQTTGHGSWFWSVNLCLIIKTSRPYVLDHKSLVTSHETVVQVEIGVAKPPSKPSLLNLSVEEENLAAIPFAVLERRVGKRVGKIELKGTKILPDGTEMRVVWQVQGNNDLGLPTEQDLDIFVALGVLTFRSNFAKTVSFTGREIAKILDIGTVHGKFYQRLKMAMDRFIPLRFRALAENERQEEVKWLNVFQEASFSLDRTTGRCTGSVTWTDKLIQSMDSGFFRLMDAGRYMELDGITAKHLYRFLAVAFEKTDLVIIDARKLSTEHLGILTPPKYLSRLMQTLEPAFDQLIRIQILGSYHVVSAEGWRIALHRHPFYVPERKTLMIQAATRDPEVSRAYCQNMLQRGGISAKVASAYCEAACSQMDFHAIERAGQLLQQLEEEDVMPHVAASIIRRALELGASGFEGRDLLDWCEIALNVCRQKKRSGQLLKNAGGFLIKIIKDESSRRRLVSEETENALRESFRRREQAAERQKDEFEERNSILEYESFREQMAQTLFNELPETRKAALRREKTATLREQERFLRLSVEMQEREVELLALQDIARREVAPFEKWRLRRQAQQAILPFQTPSGDAAEAVIR